VPLPKIEGEEATALAALLGRMESCRPGAGRFSVILDLKSVISCSRAALDPLNRLAQHLLRSGGCLVLHSLRPEVAALLQRDAHALAVVSDQAAALAIAETGNGRPAAPADAHAGTSDDYFASDDRPYPTL